MQPRRVSWPDSHCPLPPTLQKTPRNPLYKPLPHPLQDLRMYSAPAEIVYDTLRTYVPVLPFCNRTRTMETSARPAWTSRGRIQYTVQYCVCILHILSTYSTGTGTGTVHATICMHVNTPHVTHVRHGQSQRVLTTLCTYSRYTVVTFHPRTLRYNADVMTILDCWVFD